MHMWKSLIFSVVFTGIVGTVGAYEIVATVNDEVISDYDVSTRIKMMEVLMKMPPDMANSVETRRKVLDTLIDEQIKMQEATARNIELTEEEVAHGIAYLEEQNQMAPGTLQKIFKDNQIDFDTLERQIKSDLVWLKILRSENEKPPVVTDAEILAEQDKLKKEAVKPAYLLAEIYIPFGKDKVAAQNQINALFEQIVAGTSFPELALAHSKGPTASAGGDLGWVRPGKSEKAVEDVLPRMKAGQLSKPIEGKDGYYLILMREQQKELTSTDVEAWDVSQLLIPKDKLIPVMTEIQKNPDCAAFNALAEKEGLPGSGPMGDMVVARMPAQLYQILKDVPVGTVKGPIDADDFYLFLMKCGSKIVSVLPDKEVIKNQLQMVKMEDISADMLKELRQNAVIEKK